MEGKGVWREHKRFWMGRKMKRVSGLLFLILATNTFAQKESWQGFIIDQSKPYVYLKFDHIGPRKPVQNGEGNMGLWLRVVNNCRIPIVFMSFNMPTGEPGVGLMDEVVKNEPMIQIFSTASQRKEIQRRERAEEIQNICRMATRLKRRVSSMFSPATISFSAYR